MKATGFLEFLIIVVVIWALVRFVMDVRRGIQWIRGRFKEDPKA